MTQEAIKPPPHATHCQTCGQKYVHIEHPLKPGVIMMSSCDCKPTLTNEAVIEPLEAHDEDHICEECPPELTAWLDKVRESIECETHLHYWVNTETDRDHDSVIMWPCPTLLTDDFGNQDVDLAEMSVNVSQVAATFEMVDVGWVPGALAFDGRVNGKPLILTILEGPPPDDEDEEDEEEKDPN